MPPAYPAPKNQHVSLRMKRNRKTNSKPELRLRSELYGRGLRFRKNLRIKTAHIAVRPDVVFPRRRLAVFVDGCFWHACPEHGTLPRLNTDYWHPKLQKNVVRDRLVDELLDHVQGTLTSSN